VEVEEKPEAGLLLPFGRAQVEACSPSMGTPLLQHNTLRENGFLQKSGKLQFFKDFGSDGLGEGGTEQGICRSGPIGAEEGIRRMGVVIVGDSGNMIPRGS